MDKVIESAEALKSALLAKEEIKEYLHLKSLIEKDENLSNIRQKIKAANGKEKVRLINEYNASPLVMNYLSIKEEVDEILLSISNIIKI